MTNKDMKKNKSFSDWIDYRLPAVSFIFSHILNYKTPKNLSYMWSFGSIGGIGLVLQIITGIFLSMHYTPHVNMAFDSVEHIMRDVRYGWLIRYLHSVGASMFFLSIYIHIARGLYYGSYKPPRELLWFFGVFIFILMMATAFMGYVLPWGQMSFWAATVITNLFSAIPVLGENIVTWLWGGYSVSNPTLNRFFTLHYLLPFIIVFFVILHILALHTHGSNNPSGLDIKNEKDTVKFHPYYTSKDAFYIFAYAIFFSYFVFFNPNFFGHPDNYIPADPLVTPPHIVPEWYFLMFYAMLRSVPNKFLGVIVMFSAIFVLFILPYVDYHKTKSGRYRPIFKKFYVIFILNCIFLSWLGKQEAVGIYITLSRFSLFYYFSYFFVILPILSKYEKVLQEPKSINDDYLNRKLI